MNITGTQVHITVYAPKRFFTQKIEVFFHQDKPAYVVKNPYKVQAYGRYTVQGCQSQTINPCLSVKNKKIESGEKKVNIYFNM